VNVHSVTKWVTAALVPAFVIPNVLKWHWWRFNGHGFWAGMIAGTLSALLIPVLAPGLRDVGLFLAILAISAVVSIGVCMSTAPEPEALLTQFYRTVRPWGFWGPVLRMCRATTPDLEPNRGFRRDAFNVAVGIVWQLAMISFPIYLVLHQYDRMLLALGVFGLTSWVLKRTWYDRLGPGEMYLEGDQARR
jgi:solute:Na+ symporter, SSS family